LDAGTAQADFPPGQGATLACICTAAGLHDGDHAAVHLGDELLDRCGRRGGRQRGNGFAMTQGVAAHRADADVDGVVFLHPLRGLRKGIFRAKVGEDALQPAGATSVLDSGRPAKGTEFGPGASQAQQLFGDADLAVGGLPAYFFLMCLMAEGCSRRACTRLAVCFSSAQSPRSSRPSCRSCWIANSSA
jgi:hypothetical protein